MDKRFFNAFVSTAMAVLACGCAKETVTEGDSETKVSFSIELPGAPVTRAGEGTTATKLYYQAFDADGNVIEGLGVQTTPITNKTATVNFELIKEQTYNFVFWAQTNEENYYTIDTTNGLKAITANYDGKSSNDENFDAFYAVKNLTVTGPVSETVELKRPFAQINIGSTGTIKTGNASREIDFIDATSTVTVTGIPTVFSPLEKTTQFSETKNVEFAEAGIPDGNLTVNEKTYRHLAFNYVFAPTAGTVYDIKATIKVEGKTVNVNVPAAPAKQNWKTNIVGDILTADGEIKVVVSPAFEGNEDIDLANIKNETSLKALFANGGSANLDADIDLTSAAGLSIPSGKSVVLNLNGHNIVNTVAGTSAITVSGKLEITGDGTVNGGEGGDNTAIWSKPGSEVVIRGGKYTVGGDAKGQANSCIYNYGGDITIYDGYFRSECPWNNKYYVLNLNNKQHGDIVVYGGQYENFNPADGDDNVQPTTFVAEGYAAVASYDEATSTTVYTVVKATTDYASLLDEIENGGGNIAISKDITVTEKLSLASGNVTNISVEKGATLTGELTGYAAKLISLFNSDIKCTLSGEGTILGPTTQNGSAAAAVELEDNSNVLIIDGNLTIKGREGTVADHVDAGIIIRAGKVVVNNGHFIASKDVNGGDNPAILLYSPNGYRSELIINGGIFESECEETKFLINIQDEYRDHATVKIQGGTFVGFNPANNTAEGPGTNFVAAGYKSVETEYNGKKAWEVVKE